MVLEGLVEVEAQDGERRTFEPGSVLLVTDTEGPRASNQCAQAARGIPGLGPRAVRSSGLPD